MRFVAFLCLIVIGSSHGDYTETTTSSSPFQPSPLCPPVYVPACPTCPACPTITCPSCPSCPTCPIECPRSGSCKCKDGYTWDQRSGNCYKVMTVVRNWNAANAQCQAEGGEITSIKSREEWQFVKGLLNINGIYQRVWINGNDVTNEGSWVWTDGTPVVFSDWSPGRPGNDTGKNCITLMEDREWKWHDVDCSSNRLSVCKIPA